MLRAVPSGLALSFALLACSGKYAGMWVASVQTIDGHQQGSAGPIAWWAGDMQIVSKENDEGAYDLYLFTLVLRNTQTVPVTLTRLEWNVSDEDIIRPSPRSQAGSWPIAALGERRFTWPYSIVCPMLYTCAPAQTVEPTWSFRFTGTTANGERVEVPITVTLPPQTLRTRFQAHVRPSPALAHITKTYDRGTPSVPRGVPSAGGAGGALSRRPPLITRSPSDG
ncbi:MAG: hypothetical protein ACREKS_11675 [Candidatus Rokuibacteriota bacterium]